MPFILRRLRPSSHFVFTTDDPALAKILGQNNWKVREIECRPEQQPEVSPSCLVEKPDSEVFIDEKFFFGDRAAEQVKARLRENGYSDPDFRFVGVTSWSRRTNAVESLFEGVIRLSKETVRNNELQDEGKRS